jgi:hypothetical protein
VHSLNVFQYRVKNHPCLVIWWLTAHVCSLCYA